MGGILGSVIPGIGTVAGIAVGGVAAPFIAKVMTGVWGTNKSDADALRKRNKMSEHEIVQHDTLHALHDLHLPKDESGDHGKGNKKTNTPKTESKEEPAHDDHPQHT